MSRDLPEPAAAPTSPAPRPDGPACERYREDWELVRACVQGNRDSWREILERHEATVYFTLLHTLRTSGDRPSEDTVRDLQADLFMALVKDDFRRLRRYSGRCKLSHWLKIVASNRAIDHLRLKRPQFSMDDEGHDGARALRRGLTSELPDPERALSRRQRLEAVRELYEQLPEADRAFLDLHIQEERSFEEIAEAMETTVGAIYARKNRVRKKLIELARARGLFP